MMHGQFRIRMKGDLAEHLPEFLERLGLQRCGRLDDDWDQKFGWRELRPRNEGWVNLSLWRGFEDDDWSIDLTYEKDPLPADDAEQLRLRALDAAAAAGMTVTAQSGLEPPRSAPAGMRSTTSDPRRRLFRVRR